MPDEAGAGLKRARTARARARTAVRFRARSISSSSSSVIHAEPRSALCRALSAATSPRVSAGAAPHHHKRDASPPSATSFRSTLFFNRRRAGVVQACVVAFVVSLSLPVLRRWPAHTLLARRPLLVVYALLTMNLCVPRRQSVLQPRLSLADSPPRPILLFLTANRQAPVRSDLPVKRTQAEWRELLPPDAFHVLVERGTERAGTSALNEEERPGTFACAGCGSPLFLSEAEYDSGTGWPSFCAAIDGAVDETVQYASLSPSGCDVALLDSFAGPCTCWVT